MGPRQIIRIGWVTQTGDLRTTRRRSLRRAQHRRGTIIAMITVHLRLIAPTRIIELIIRDLIAHKRTIVSLTTRTWAIKPITAVLSARTRTTARIILGRGARRLSTLRRTIRRRRIQPRLRIRLPNMQPHSTMHMKLHALSHLTMSIMTSRLTKQAERDAVTNTFTAIADEWLLIQKAGSRSGFRTWMSRIASR